MFKTLPFRLLFTVLLLNAWNVHAESLKVAVSISPLHSLVSHLGKDVFEPSLIYSTDQSPHSSALKPSQLQQVVDADVLIWVGEDLEQSLGRLIEQRALKSTIVQLFDENGLTGYEHGLKLLENRPSLFPQQEGLHDDHDSHDEHDAHEHGHDHGQLDPHFWLDPLNAIAFSKAVAEQLIQLDPSHKDNYEANLKQLIIDLNILNRNIHVETAGLKTKPFIVFHDGFQYFEATYQLNGIGAVVLNPEQPPGPKTLSLLIDAAKNYSVTCLFSEPQYDARYLNVIQSKLPFAKIGVIDTLGSKLEPGPTLYFELLTQLSASMSECLE
ncbi:zinc ABC transporter substrate-binding protein [Reinekea marina]|uniref:High-affinity zinc uptake system protein ZnuA n=1 Tax=Reinekea marina TaxID=1310421 RepID=A0ABV7WTW1_9GAMM|nr:zinc ABC transporter substrate-binding protein [Reinekea marina]MDN3649823.1 zinc ABC transporter substrate-binding protein [Reinekea marina]